MARALKHLKIRNGKATFYYRGSNGVLVQLLDGCDKFPDVAGKCDSGGFECLSKGSLDWPFGLGQMSLFCG